MNARGPYRGLFGSQNELRYGTDKVVTGFEIRVGLTEEDLPAVAALQAHVRTDLPLARPDVAPWADAIAGRATATAATVAAGSGDLIGAAVALRRDNNWTIELITGEREGVDQAPLTVALLGATCDAVAERGGGAVLYWVEAATEEDTRVAGAAGFEPHRRLEQLRVALPLPHRSDLSTTAFRPGVDDDEWLRVNNRAFHWHPEQGGWTHENLRERMAESWFDPAGFLLHFVGDHLAGFCWTKIHVDTNPPLGEIFVIATDPDHHRTGLGRKLVLTGLDWLHRHGCQLGMLYVEADNAPARELYRSLGFTLHQTDIAYRRVM
ncbi:MAG: Mycothiol acetyltransferase [Acidimicrobiales bacterium]|nr:Mycothiol acetyltransferase [Acidimicrobiales bacterium]